ncbi:hypothetical protein EDB92DRAFT_721691 [Lactarius akahatsu]|uniref:Arf-GAP domain-containing protein n=1 Tax=Lactarius akahatsu TaxID=416441 RepID=A0AAD4LH68_9AGAM|nr:hypothetical protein EDB92DRAFT_721691 [Lactarius akahatsu]
MFHFPASSTMSGTVSKIAAERNQKAILELAMKPGNDSCADCKTRNPRWASHNLGIFICVNCASIHRKIGTHVSKVKSLTMDVWTKEQVENMRQAGNIKSNQQYNPDEVRNPPPTNMIDAERDSELEKFIRDKYEFKRFIGRVDRSAVVAAHLGPSRSAASVKSSASSSSFSNSLRSQTLPPAKPSLPSATSAPPSPARAPTLPPSVPASTAMSRSVSQPISPQARLQPPQPPAGVWSDLASLQSSTGTSTLPLQYLSPSASSSLLAPSSSSHFNFNPAAGPSSLSANFTQGVSPGHGPASQGPGFGVGASPVSGLSIATQSSHPSFASGATAINPFAQMVAQQQSQAQAQPNHFPTTSPFGSLPSQQPYFSPQGQVPQIQQPAFSQLGTNPFFNGSAQSQHMLSQPQAPIMSTTPSPIPYTGSPFQQPTQSPFQQQPPFQPGVQAQFQPQPPQFGNVQPSSATATGNPFTSWLTQQPNSYASAHAGQGSGQWGVI